MDALIAATADRIFRDHCDKATLDAAEAGEFPAALWQAFQGAGLHLTGSPVSGTGLEDLFGVVKLAGYHAAPLPIAETLLANSSLDGDDDGLITIAVNGVAPWGRCATLVVHAANGEVQTKFKVAHGHNLAGEPRDRITGRRRSGTLVDEVGLHALLALSRAALMAGAMTRVLELAVGYAGERQQFGRPIARFQAVQQGLAVLASEVAAAQRAADGAIECVGEPNLLFQVAAAKARVGEAAGIVAEIAHQVHGAMGFTHEHTLHHFTRRLWAWREECGTEREWQFWLGQQIAEQGADALWGVLTALEG